MGELRFCFTGLSNMHRYCAFAFALAGLFLFTFLIFPVSSLGLLFLKLAIRGLRSAVSYIGGEVCGAAQAVLMFEHTVPGKRLHLEANS